MQKNNRWWEYLNTSYVSVKYVDSMSPSRFLNYLNTSYVSVKSINTCNSIEAT